MAKLRRRNERRAMKVVEGVDDGRRGEQGQVAKAEDRKRKRRERLNEIVDDSLKTLYRLERIC
ncbi:hypothetical protein ALC60_04850 [Trachymyrmex zeteki]|uniref:Uncharacterized protein n=1 Tax=Mycetomoellerius zeteki TaxID=64791 RepID=A0A151X786_9HYME|nr:hypothetical protein ALC60_04850 [Trachymyrmex zeteki]